MVSFIKNGHFNIFVYFRAYNVPEKYIKDIERKSQMNQKSRFTYAYFGLK